MKYRILVIILLSVIYSMSAYGQVTIGSKKVPEFGALLDLKDNKASTVSGGITTTKGLGLPRVRLTDGANLFPMFETSPGVGIANNDYNTVSKKELEDRQHIGLVVYNPDKCTLQGEGLYVWEEDGWNKLAKDKTSVGLNLSSTNLTFWNGLSMPLDISWNPSTLAPPTYTATGFTVTMEPDPLIASPVNATIKLNDMKDIELSSNQFKRKEGSIIFSLPNSPCSVGGASQIQKLNIAQVNKALLVNGSVNPEQILVTTNKAGTTEITIQSNARWMMEVFPATKKAISSPDMGMPKGTDDDSGNQSLAKVVSVSINGNNVNAPVHRVNFLIFSDIHTPKRFKDVVLVVNFCPYMSSTSSLFAKLDFTMEEYKDLWENMYGVKAGDEPDSNGSELNTNQVQWHYDQNEKDEDGNNHGNIFFSAMFGDKRWMTTNLAATVYDTGIGIRPSPITNAYWMYSDKLKIPKWGYHGGDNAYDATNPATYNEIQRHGVLYNWVMFSANGESTNQGICPNGWRLPTINEYEKLIKEVKRNLAKYTYATSVPSQPLPSIIAEGRLLMNTCTRMKMDSNTNVGLSKSFLNGGFDFLPTSGYANLKAEGRGDNGGVTQSYIGTSEYTIANDKKSVKVKSLFFKENGVEINDGITDKILVPVRCVKND